jgi:shikimate kinase
VTDATFARNLVLIGYRGAGKTTVARRLALTLGWDWVDADVEIELRAGKSIAAIFSDDGEQAFRDLESQVVTELCRRHRHVLAVGGGAVLRPENRRALRRAGHVVWLRVRPETVLARLAADPSTTDRRPNLTTAGGEAEVRQLIEARRPIYDEVADCSVDTDGKSPERIADEILALSQDSPRPLEPA